MIDAQVEAEGMVMESQSRKREMILGRYALGGPRVSARLHGLRRAAIAVSGFGVLAFGVALIVVPVPGTTIVIIPFGLAILSKEFDWARRLIGSSRDVARRLWAGARRCLPPVWTPMFRY